MMRDLPSFLVRIFCMCHRWRPTFFFLSPSSIFGGRAWRRDFSSSKKSFRSMAVFNFSRMSSQKNLLFTKYFFHFWANKNLAPAWGKDVIKADNFGRRKSFAKKMVHVFCGTLPKRLPFLDDVSTSTNEISWANCQSLERIGASEQGSQTRKVMKQKLSSGGTTRRLLPQHDSPVNTFMVFVN